MSNRHLNTKLFIVICIILIIVSALVTYNFCKEDVIKTDTVYTTRVDTIKDTVTLTKIQPQLMVIETLKKDTVYNDKGEQFELITEQKKCLDTLYNDKDTAYVDITISGINAKVDSIGLQLRKSHYIHTNTVEITKTIKDKKKLFISPQVGLGYGIKSKEFDMYIGLGLSINL